MSKWIKAAVGAVALVVTAISAQAQQLPPGYPKRPQVSKGEETGLHTIHSIRKVGRKTCFVDHFHHGSGSGQSRKAAEASAIQAWQSFTDFEYGGSWGNWRIAESRTMECNQGGLGGGWSCSADAIPCRPF